MFMANLTCRCSGMLNSTEAGVAQEVFGWVPDSVDEILSCVVLLWDCRLGRCAEGGDGVINEGEGEREAEREGERERESAPTGGRNDMWPE